jgi:phosphoserine phosphatase
MIVAGTSLDSAIASADLPLAVGPAMTTSGGFSVLIATLVAENALSKGDISAASDALSAAGCDGMTSSWIEDGSAADIVFSGDVSLARAAIEALPSEIDVIVQSSAMRRRSLIIADMDSTMITVECIDELADYAGIKPQIAAITEAAMRGELDFEAALRQRVGLLEGLPVATIAQCLADRVRIMPGAKALVQTIKSHGGHAVLVSGGFLDFAEPVGREIGFDRVVANALGKSGDVLNGMLAADVVGSETKRETLLATIAERGISADDTLAVGDGANDIPMIEAAGLGVAYHAKPKAVAAADAAIRHGDLTVLLYAMGYKRSDWIIA